MFNKYYEELSILNEEKLTEGSYFYSKQFWDYAKQSIISYDDFYYAYKDDINKAALNSLFDAEHKLINKGTYGKIKEYNDAHQNDYFGKALLKLWVLQFKDNAESLEDFKKRQAEERKKQREEKEAQINAKIRPIVNDLVAKNNEIEKQCFDAAKIVIQDKETIRLVELVKYLGPFYYWRGHELDYDLTNLDKWCYDSVVSEDKFKINFRFGHNSAVEFKVPSKSYSGELEFWNKDERAQFLNEVFWFTSTSEYELNEAQKFKESVDTNKLKGNLIDNIRNFINNALLWYEHNYKIKLAEEKAKKEKDEARLKLVNTIKQYGSSFTNSQADRVNELLTKIIDKWRKHIDAEASFWSDSTDGSDGAAVAMAEYEAFEELSPIFREIHWAAFDGNKLIAEFDPNKDDENALEKAFRIILYKPAYFRFFKD